MTPSLRNRLLGCVFFLVFILFCFFPYRVTTVSTSSTKVTTYSRGFPSPVITWQVSSYIPVFRSSSQNFTQVEEAPIDSTSAEMNPDEILKVFFTSLLSVISFQGLIINMAFWLVIFVITKKYLSVTQNRKQALATTGLVINKGLDLIPKIKSINTQGLSKNQVASLICSFIVLCSFQFLTVMHHESGEMCTTTVGFPIAYGKGYCLKGAISPDELSPYPVQLWGSIQSTIPTKPSPYRTFLPYQFTITTYWKWAMAGDLILAFAGSLVLVALFDIRGLPKNKEKK